MKCYLDLNWVRTRKCLAYNVSLQFFGLWQGAWGQVSLDQGDLIQRSNWSREDDALQHLVLGRMKNAENTLTWKHGRVQKFAAACFAAILESSTLAFLCKTFRRSWRVWILQHEQSEVPDLEKFL